MVCNKKYWCIVFFLYGFFLLYGQTNTTKQEYSVFVRDLGVEQADWNTVLSGQALCPPQLTSYGFVVLTDGRMVSGFSENGNLLWQVALPGRPKNFFTVSVEDFIYVITNNRYVSLINSNGIILWTVDTEFEITDAPVPGDDGRVFIKGADTIACYGINGIRKWKLRTSSLSSLPLCTLNDGTILVFLQTTDATMQTLRISPFGEELEYISLEHGVIAAQSCGSGLLVVYTTGTAEFYRIASSLQDPIGTLSSVWHSDRVVPSSSHISIVSLKNGMCGVVAASSRKTDILVFLSDTGDLVSSASLKDFVGGEGMYVQGTEDGMVVSNATSCRCYRFDAPLHNNTPTSSVLKWNCTLPGNQFPWNYIAYSQQGALIICGKSWELHGYRVYPEKVTKYTVPAGVIYEHFYGIPLEEEKQIAVTERLLEKGDYALHEIAWTNTLRQDIASYYAKVSERASHPTAIIPFEEVEKDSEIAYFALTGLFGTSVFQNAIIALARNEKDPAYVCQYIRIMAQNAYDPGGKMLDTLQKIIERGFAQQQVCIAVCDAAYQICHFMGNRQMNIKGHRIVSMLTSEKYSKQINAYARNVVFLFASLDRTL